MSVEQIITITPVAAENVRRLQDSTSQQDYGLRLAVQGGGCSGFMYKLAFEPESKDDDIVIESNGIKLYVDPKSLLYLTGCSVDYVDDLMGSGFRIDNPNARNSCGCGDSFGV